MVQADAVTHREYLPHPLEANAAVKNVDRVEHLRIGHLRARIKRAKFGDPTQLATMQLTAQPNGTAAPNTRAPLRAEGAASIRTKQTAQQQQQ